MRGYYTTRLCVVGILLHKPCLARSDVSEEDKFHQHRIQDAKLDLWKRGAFFLDEGMLFPDLSDLSSIADGMEMLASRGRLAPIRKSRRYHTMPTSERTVERSSAWSLLDLRGGEGSVTEVDKISALCERLGPEFAAAIKKNEEEHIADCKKSCESFYCGGVDEVSSKQESFDNITFVSYSMGPVPPEDFASDFQFPLDIIKVSKSPYFTPEEAQEVITTAEKEGLSNNEYQSGKYKLGGDWLLNLPKTREWFNEKLKTVWFPTLANLFPQIISSPDVLRAHSVSLLKYNSSHPRTDVHIDNGILAMTIAMTPSNEYVGGGTFFEHMGNDNVLPMDVGFGTFRPGSVRHGGHRVEEGTRYILGSFLLIEDRVEHVRRMKNRGSKLRREGNLEEAMKHFEWALEINPKCTTCLKDLAEILLFKKDFSNAEIRIRKALELLENQDSDALFTLGLILSEQGRDEESIQAYQKSVKLNAEDAELCYNLGIKLGARGNVEEEMDMYQKTTEIDPFFGGAWLNWGTALAEKGNMEEAETKFQKAMDCCPDVAPKAMLNLALVYQSTAGKFAATGNMESALKDVKRASEHLDKAKPLLDAASATDNSDDDVQRYLSQFKPLRLQAHKLTGQILAASRDFVGCEAEFRRAVENFPNEAGAWDMLARVLDIQGKQEEAATARQKASTLNAINGAFGI